MYHGTAPTIILPVEGMDMTGHTVQVAFKPAVGEKIIRSTPDISVIYEDDTSFILIPFSQQQAFDVPEGVCQVEVRSISPTGVPYISYIASMDVVGSMTNNVIQYQGGDNT